MRYRAVRGNRTSTLLLSLLVAAVAWTSTLSSARASRTPAVESGFRSCANGFDDDCDGLADCADPDCQATCERANCSDGIDNDGDGRIDCRDSDCTDPLDPSPDCCVPAAPETSVLCVNGIDDDCDGELDCHEPDCVGFQFMVPFSPATLGCFGLGQRVVIQEADYPGPSCEDGLDNDGTGFIDCADASCAGGPVCATVPEAHCADGLDNDGDGALDCADTDCATFCVGSGLGGGISRVRTSPRNDWDTDFIINACDPCPDDRLNTRLCYTRQAPPRAPAMVTMSDGSQQDVPTGLVPITPNVTEVVWTSDDGGGQVIAGGLSATPLEVLRAGAVAVGGDLLSPLSFDDMSLFQGSFAIGQGRFRRALISAGTLKVEMTDRSGNPITSFPPGAPLELMIRVKDGVRNPETLAPVAEGDTVPILYYDEVAHAWVPHPHPGTSVPQIGTMEEDDDGLFVRFTTDHLTSFNLDWDVEICADPVVVQVVDAAGDPLPGASLELARFGGGNVWTGSSPDGVFEFPDFPIDTVILQGQHGGLYTNTETIVGCIPSTLTLTVAAANSPDPDSDGLENVEEAMHETDPNQADTDGDGGTDGEEVAQGSDPTNPCSWAIADGNWPDFTADVPPGTTTGFNFGDVLPDFDMADQFGQTLSLHDFYGSVVILQVSTGWCHPCKGVAEELHQLAITHDDKCVVWIDFMLEDNFGQPVTTQYLHAYAEEFGLSLPVVEDLDDAVGSLEAAETLPAMGLPKMLVLDADLRAVESYNLGGMDDLVDMVETLLGP